MFNLVTEKKIQINTIMRPFYTDQIGKDIKEY